MRNIGVFISHSWKYGDDYKKLKEWVCGDNWNVSGTPLKFDDYSIPKDDPIHDAPTPRKLEERIYAEIQKSHVVIILTGVYASHSDWIQKEIACAKKYGRPILAVNLWDMERKSSVVIDAAADIVGWNKRSVVNGVWRLYRRFYNGGRC